mgnify:FL=1
MSGEHQAVAFAVANSPEEPQEEQLDLIGAPENAAVIALREKRKGPGRPAGARNRRTLEMANFLLSRYASPLEVLAQIATARVDLLTASIGCTKLEALQEKRLAALALLPYLHQKMPVAVDVTNRKVVHLTIVEGEAGGQPEGEEITLTGHIVEAVAREMIEEEEDLSPEQPRE